MSYMITHANPTPTTPRQQFRMELLQANRAVASWLGLDSRFTLSSNIALAVSMRTGVAFGHAKQWFHGGVSGFVAAMLGFFGAGLGAALGLASLLFVWLESFDASGQLR
jgi:hypothetical protein